MEENTKLITEAVSDEVKALIRESIIPDNIRKDVYRRVMEYKQLSIERGRRPKVFKKDLDRAEFQHHYDEWRLKTYGSSDPIKIMMDSDFQAIIDMGYRAIPFIYQIISKRDDFIAFTVPDIVGHLIGEPSYSIPELCKRIKKYIEDTGLV